MRAWLSLLQSWEARQELLRRLSCVCDPVRNRARVAEYRRRRKSAIVETQSHP